MLVYQRVLRMVQIETKGINSRWDSLFNVAAGDVKKPCCFEPPHIWLLSLRLGGTVFGGFSNNGYPQIINFNWIFHCKPSILGYLHFWKPPCKTSQDLSFFLRQLSRNVFFGVSVANLAIWLISALGIVTIWLHRFVALSKTNRNEELPSISPKRTIVWWRSKTTALA